MGIQKLRVQTRPGVFALKGTHFLVRLAPLTASQKKRVSRVFGLCKSFMDALDQGFIVAHAGSFSVHAFGELIDQIGAIQRTQQTQES